MIRVDNLQKIYDRHSRSANHVLKNISLELPDTGFVCILGPSGCGKTSLLNAVGGLDDFQGGSISTENMTAKNCGSPLFEAERNSSFGYIFQNYYLLQKHSVGYNVYLGLHSLKLTHREKLKRVREALQAVDMDSYIRRQVSDLSGGQQQRVAIARAIARRPRVILADEPTGNLDEANTRQICTLLRRISKTSLVLMVTHEQRIARFFADRIITIDNGRITGDETAWERKSLDGADGKNLYTGDYEQALWQQNGMQLRLLQEEGAEPVNLSVLVLHDQVILKLDDSRAITCGGQKDAPVLIEGERPRLTLEEVDKQALQWEQDSHIPAKAGSGIRFRQMLTEARSIRRSGGIKKLGNVAFLLLLTVLTCICLGDWLKINSIDPEDFIVTHSKVLEVSLERGAEIDKNVIGMRDVYRDYKNRIQEADPSLVFTPHVKRTASVSGSPFLQAGELRVNLRNFTYVPMDFLDESTLILGRMPENSCEVVVDRWVLDAIREREGVAQNGIRSLDYFLGKTLGFDHKLFEPTIVGICDSAEPAVYISRDLLVSNGNLGTNIASLSSLQARYPGQYDDVVLGEDECIVVPAVAGLAYAQENASFRTPTADRFKIVGICEATDYYPAIIVADERIDRMMREMSFDRFYIFTEDKAATTELLYRMGQEEMANSVKVTVKDVYKTNRDAYYEATRLRADARTIISISILVLSAVMLILLRRTHVHEQLGMLSVYRLLGIPGRKTVGIFFLESLSSTAVTVLPAVLAVWLVVRLLGDKVQMLLPLGAAFGVYGAVVVFHLIVSLLPLLSLLRLPPARLAAKYDLM